VVETQALTGPERVEAWRPPVAGVREVFHARFVDHAYPPHTHDAWGIVLVEAGAIRYRLDRHDHGSFRSVVTVLPPHVVHDGRAATGAGFRKRVLYLEPDVLGEARTGPAVDAPTLADPVLGDWLRRLHDELRGDGPVADPLASEARLAFVVERLAAHLDHRAPVPPGGGPALGDPAGAVAAAWTGDDRHGTGAHGLTSTGPRRDRDGAVARAGRRRTARALAADLRALLDGPSGGAVTLAAAGAQLGASATHLVRVFTAAYGMPPHAYVVARRVDDARGRLLAGQAPAEVAAAAGFHDQAHLTRHFRRHVGTTPARYAASGSGGRGRGR
jgi:AraC-like DNA-binding protein